MKLLQEANGNIPRSNKEKQSMIEEAAKHYGKFLTALGFDWKADENSSGTPHRVAKAWVEDIVSGCVNQPPKIKDFPTTYTGMIFEGDIEVGSIPTQKIIELGNTLGTFSESTAIKLSNLDRDAIYSNDHKQGILLGFPKIDGDYGGLMPGDFVLFTGRPKSYKTLSTNFVAYNVASNYEKVFTDASAQGKKVLYLSGEMTPNDIVIRMDAIGGKFNSKHLRTGSAKSEEYKQRATRSWSIIHEHGGELIIPKLGAIRAENILEEINKYEPDLVICDALYRFETKQEGWRGDAQLVTDTCNIARITQTPIIATNQLTREATPGEISLSNIAYSDSYAREAALILAMYSFEDRPNVSTIKVLASRHSSSVYGDEIEYDFSNSTYSVL